jgi:hypothetical protein
MPSGFQPTGSSTMVLGDKLVHTEYQPLEQAQPPLHLGEKTGFQAVITSPWVMRWAAVPATYATYREIRKHPTIALARMLSVAPIMASEWSVKAKDNVPPEWVKLIQDVFLPLREKYLEPTLLYGNVDFGYQPFEKVFEPKDGYIKLTRLKPLLHDITEICIGHQGSFIGFRQVGQELGVANAMHVGFRVEGSYLYGIPLLENVRQIYNDWWTCNRGAQRYDQKIAGAHVVVEYPVGVGTDQSGTEIDNSILADRVLKALESAGGVCVPRDVAAYMQQMGTDNPGWKIWIMDQGTNQQEMFVNRLEYLDKLLCRGLLLPERSVLEGHHGTKAEAKSHMDAAMTVADLTHRYVTKELNEQAVDQTLELNFGAQARGAVELEASPIVDDRRELLEKVLETFLADPNGFAEASGLMDLDSLLDTLGVPKGKETDKPSEGPDAAQALPGMDPNDPRAATVRRLYRGANGQPVNVPAGQVKTPLLPIYSAPEPVTASQPAASILGARFSSTGHPHADSAVADGALLKRAVEIVTPQWENDLVHELRDLLPRGGPGPDGFLANVKGFAVYAKDFAPIEATADMDLVVGGNFQRYPTLIPENQIWIDRKEAPAEWTHIALHEIVETVLMLSGWTYDDAHKVANFYERQYMRKEL